MTKCVRSSAIFIFFSCFWLISALTPAFGGGGRDADLLKADELIAKKEYDEAIRILTEYARGSQDRFDRAQPRLRKIISIQEEFNKTADDLVHTLLDDPDNAERILALTMRLSDLENENSPVMVNFVSRTRDIALFNVSRNRLRAIMERGRELLDSGDHLTAIQTYASGMDLMRDEFFSAGYGQVIYNSVRQETEIVNAVLASYREGSAEVQAISAELARAISAGNFADISEINSRLAPVEERYIRLKRNLVSASAVYDRILDGIKADDPEMGDRSHLSFLAVLINGRPGEDIQEGMLGAFDLNWNNTIGLCIEAASSSIERMNASALAAFNSGDYPSASSLLNERERYAALLSPLFRSQIQFNEEKLGQSVLVNGELVLNQDFPLYFKSKALQEANTLLYRAANVPVPQNIDRSSFSSWQEGRLNFNAAVDQEQRIRTLLNTARNEIDEILTSGNQTNLEINSYYQTAYIGNTLDAIEKLRASVASEQTLSAQRYYEIYYADLQNQLSSRREELARGRNYLEGQTHTNDAGIDVIYRYPAEALAEFTSMLSALSDNLDRGTSVLTLHRNEPSAISQDARISTLRSGTQNLIDELNNLRTQSLALAETARGQATLAETHRQEGERLLREAQAAFQRQDYNMSRDRLQRASERLTNSLEIQESASVRQVWDTQLIVLGQSINQAENETIILEVRNLVNGARDSYYAGNFQQAEEGLLRARNRWLLTHVEENEEVVYWLGIIRSAMSARSDRLISPTAPLYTEMSQLLSRAQRNYEEGVRMINAGQRAQGLAKFEEARQLTREVKLMFPVNQEAGILELRMEQFTDPTAFNAAFAQRLNTAIAGTEQRSVESFADLQNLAEINPRYPNMAAIINRAEIAMGYRPPPPNPANIARSNELTNSASRILDGNLSNQYEVALEQVNEAIRLNPDNANAARVKDRLLNRMSVPGGIVLSSEDEEDYQRAMRELQAGNNLVAFALVERLMQTPGNRNISKLVELQRRIQSVMQ